MAACLHWTGYSVFLWDGKTLANIGYEGGTANAGESWETIELIFPKDKGGKKEEGWIVKKEISGIEDYIGNSVETITTTVWVWDGKQLVQKK
jgi:hypothetical protein